MKFNEHKKSINNDYVKDKIRNKREKILRQQWTQTQMWAWGKCCGFSIEHIKLDIALNLRIGICVN